MKFNAQYGMSVGVWTHILLQQNATLAQIICLINVMDESDKSPTLGQRLKLGGSWVSPV